MKKVLFLLSILFCSYIYGQTFVLPPRSSPAVTVQDARWRGLLSAYMPHTHGLTLNGGIDTVGAFIYEDSSRHIWYRDTVVSGGHKWTMVLTQPDVIITGLVQQGANVTVTGAGTPSSPYIINATGSGGGGITLLAFSASNGFTGSFANPSGPTATLSIGTSVNGIMVGNGTGVSAAGIGAGLSFIAGTLANTITNNNQLTNGNNYISNITGLVTQGSNITITGAGTIGSPYVINGSASGGGITGAGNLVPIFTTSIVANTLGFVLTNANAYTVFGNFTGSAAVPTYGQPVLTSPMFANQGTTTTLLIGNGSGNLSFGAVNLSTMVTNILAAINGGTGQSSYTIGDILYASSSTALSKLADAAVGNVLLSGGIGVAPLYGKVDLSSMVTSTLPAANGGTGNNIYTVGDLLVATGTTTLTPLNDVAVNNVLLSQGVGISPQYGKLPIVAIANIPASVLLGNSSGSIGPVSTIQLGLGLTFNLGKLAIDTANFKDSIPIRNLGGSTYDSFVYAINSNTLGFRKILFSGATVTHNSDSSLIVAYPGGSSGYSVTTAVNTANYTVPTGRRILVYLTDLTGQANRNVVLPAATIGDEFVFVNMNGAVSGFAWTFTSGTVKDNAQNTITTLVNNEVYHLVFGGTNYQIIN